MERKYIIMNYTNTPDAPAAIGPYSQAISANGFLFASGQVPLMPGTGEIVGTTIEEQAERACQSIKAILAANGLGFEMPEESRAKSYLALR